MLSECAISGLEFALNQALTLDDTAPARMIPLEHQLVEFHFVPMNVSLYFYFSAHRIYLFKEYDATPDVRFSGTPLALARLQLTQDKSILHSGEVVMDGEVITAQAVHRLFSEFSFDWEESFSYLVGDTVTEGLSRLIRNVTRWMLEVRQNMQDNITEYLQEEAMIFPPAQACEDLFHDIDALSMDVDRIEARIRLLSTGEPNAKST